MPSDLIDRRDRSYRGRDRDDDEGDDDFLDAARSAARDYLGLPRLHGSPELSDHQQALLCIEAACHRFAATLARPISRRTLRWHTLSGPRSRVVESPSSSSRYGHQPHAERNLRVYLYHEVLGLSLAEIGRRVGLKKSGAHRAKSAGARLALIISRSAADPRKGAGPAAGRRPRSLAGGA